MLLALTTYKNTDVAVVTTAVFGLFVIKLFTFSSLRHSGFGVDLGMAEISVWMPVHHLKLNCYSADACHLPGECNDHALTVHKTME